MTPASTHSASSIEAIQAALDGASLVLYSVARPPSPEVPVDRSGKLATFTFASPAFESGAPRFETNPALATGTGTPGFARAFKADGTPIADFAVGPISAEITLSEVSTTPGYPIAIKGFRL